MLSDLKADSTRWLKEKQYSPNLGEENCLTSHSLLTFSQPTRVLRRIAAASDKAPPENYKFQRQQRLVHVLLGHSHPSLFSHTQMLSR
jgi:hypothetical protein